MCVGGGQVGVKYGWWMICACLVGFCAYAIPTSPKHSWNVILFTCNQEYIIKERREYWTYKCFALNVCRESHAWNANYLTTISKYVVVCKHHQTSIHGGTAIVGIPKHVTLHIHSTHSIRVFSTLFSLLLCTLAKSLAGQTIDVHMNSNRPCTCCIPFLRVRL